MRRDILRILSYLAEPVIIIALIPFALVARFVPKKIDIGLGPLPLINNIYHKKVFESCGYSAETFVHHVWHITSDFDIRADQHPLNKVPKIGYRLNMLRFAISTLFRYRCIVMYFNGGILGIGRSFLLWRAEPFILSLANVKTLILAYGSDVQDMSRSPNLLFKDAMSRDYPSHKNSRKWIAGKIDLWTSYGNHVVGGCEWVDYMFHWDTLMISHFSINEKDWEVSDKAVSYSAVEVGPMRVLHAPNHRAVKGSDHVIKAVEALKAEGCNIELVLVEKRPNHEIRELIRSSDVVVDQLIVGWYAMFAIEAMALEKPVICNIRSDLEELYRVAGLYDENEKIPLVHATPLTIKQTLKRLYENRNTLQELGKAGRPYVMKHHSIESVAKTVGPIVQKLIGYPSSIKG